MTANLPNLLTWARIVLIPLFVGVFYFPGSTLSPIHQNEIAAAIFFVAAITDWFDGWLARKLGVTSSFGAFLDPVADKLMVAAALVVLVQLGRADAVLSFIIIGREITISALREWMAKIGASRSVAVSFVGKLKTAAQMVAIFLLLLGSTSATFTWVQPLGSVLLFVAAILTLWSMAYYLQKASRAIAEQNSSKKTDEKH